jgi:alanyl-tRNA synthetase
VLGGHVKQAGSLVAPDRLRFDFVHFSAVTKEQQLEIERIDNEQVLKNTPVQTEVKGTQEAIAAGAMALFGEKYGDKVRVVSVPGFSVELCGGTHVRATGDIGLFAITAESGVAAGVRRIEAITGLESVRAFQRDRELVGELAHALNARPEDVPAKLVAQQDEIKRLSRELQQAKMKAAMGGGTGAAQDQAVDVAGVKLVAQQVSGLDKDGLRALADQHRSRIKSGVVVLASGCHRRRGDPRHFEEGSRGRDRQADRADRRRRRRRAARLRRGGRQGSVEDRRDARGGPRRRRKAPRVSSLRHELGGDAGSVLIRLPAEV